VPSQPYTFYIGMVNGGRVEKRLTPAGPGSQSSTISRLDRSAGSRSPCPIRTSSTSGAGKGLPRPDLAVGDGHLQVDRCRPDVDAPRSARCAADSQNRHRSEEPGSIVRRGARPPVRSQSGSAAIFRSTDGGKTFEARVVRGREHRRQGCRHRSGQSRHRLRDAVGAAPGAPGKNGAWSGTHGGVFKSVDGGTTWKPLKQGLPDGHRQRRNWRSRQAIRSALFVTAEASGNGTGPLSVGRCRRGRGSAARPMPGRSAGSTKWYRTSIPRTRTPSSSQTS